MEKQGSLRRRWKELNIGRLNAFKPRLLQRPMRIDYSEVVANALEDMPPGERYLPSVLPNWDNTPRSGFRGVVYEGETPDQFKAYLQKAVNKVANHPEQQRIVFIKAWNEWAEGNYLEPDSIHGHALLNAARTVLFTDAY